MPRFRPISAAGRVVAMARGAQLRSAHETLSAFLERLPGGHRPPTGPLTTEEATEAEELRQETLEKDHERAEQEQEKRDARRDR
jgi:hypothetical protein